MTHPATPELSWKEHTVFQGDGSGGYVSHPAQLRLAPCVGEDQFWPFGLAKMDNGEIAMVGVARRLPPKMEQAVVTFSSDEGATWTEPIEIEGLTGRPMMLAYLGGGELTFSCGWSEDDHYRCFSSDYGRTWPERMDVQKAPSGNGFGTEGNPLIERDRNGAVTRIAELGHAVPGDRPWNWPTGTLCEYLRWSYDGGRTWKDEVCIDETLQWEVQYEGKTYTRGFSEGALVRAANGDLVAALRTDLPPRYITEPNMDDSLEGTGVAISKDDGNTWEPLQHLFEAGRHHANLLCMPNGDLVMTLIRRVDVRDGTLASYRRGCDALISHDNGETWNLDKMYVLDEFVRMLQDKWVSDGCGHLYSILLDNGDIFSAYANCLTGGVLIRWRP